MTDPDDLAALLEVQAVDTATDQARHRLAHLPERVELDGRIAALAALDVEEAPTGDARRAVASAQRALEDEVALLEEKAAGVDRTLYSGSVTNARELQALQEELAALGRRRDVLEEKVLEQMLEAEPLDAVLAEVAARRRTLDAEAVRWTAAVAEAEAATEAEVAGLVTRRDEVVAGVPADLLAEYEDRRRRYAGVGVARLQGSTCQGCHLALPAAQITGVRRTPPGEVPTCPECGRILVAG